MQQTITGKLSIDRLRIQYYPAGVEQITIPDATVTEYLRTHCPGLDKPALQYYGNTMTWSVLFAWADQIARSPGVLGIGEMIKPRFFQQDIDHTGLIDIANVSAVDQTLPSGWGTRAAVV